MAAPGFNGQFDNLVLSIEEGAFIDNIDGIKALLKDNEPSPVTEWDRRVVTQVVPKMQSFVPEQGDKQEIVVGGKKDAFPEDYAISGWFKFEVPKNQ